MFFKILFDFVMVVLTGGFWIIWMLIRYYHKKEKRDRIRAQSMHYPYY